jgi:hypothetical protein
MLYLQEFETSNPDLYEYNVLNIVKKTWTVGVKAELAQDESLWRAVLTFVVHKRQNLLKSRETS